MAFEGSQSWYTLRAEVFVAFDTLLGKGVGAMMKKPKLYRICRNGASLGFSPPCERLHGNVEKAECAWAT